MTIINEIKTVRLRWQVMLSEWTPRYEPASSCMNQMAKGKWEDQSCGGEMGCSTMREGQGSAIGGHRIETVGEVSFCLLYTSRCV